jgi:hypothetical protein
MSAKSNGGRIAQLQEAALEAVRLQARRPMSPEEERLLANNLLLGRGLPGDDDSSNAASDASEFDDLVAQILADDPSANEQERRFLLSYDRPNRRCWLRCLPKHIACPSRRAQEGLIAPHLDRRVQVYLAGSRTRCRRSSAAQRMAAVTVSTVTDASSRTHFSVAGSLTFSAKVEPLRKLSSNADTACLTVKATRGARGPAGRNDAGRSNLNFPLACFIS